MASGISGTSPSKYVPPHARQKVALNKNTPENRTINNQSITIIEDYAIQMSSKPEEKSAKILHDKYIPPHQREARTILNSNDIKEAYVPKPELFDDAVIINQSDIPQSSTQNK